MILKEGESGMTANSIKRLIKIQFWFKRHYKLVIALCTIKTITSVVIPILSVVD